MNLDSGDWLSPAQTARLLGLTTARIRQLSAEGKLQHIKTPNGRLYWRGEIERLASTRPTNREVNKAA
jgi:hypothetical protein